MDIRPILSTLRRHKTAVALIVLEIALSCAILCNALFIVNQRMDTINLVSGVDDERLIEVGLSGVGQATDADARTAEDLDTLRAIPGVEQAAIVNQLPFQNGSWNTSLALSADQEVSTLSAAQYMLGEHSLETLGLRLIAGRDFHAEEYKSSAVLSSVDVNALSSSAILSKAAADKLFPAGDALGKMIYMANIPITVVGVVDTLLRPNPMSGNRSYSVIFPIRMNFNNGGRYVVRVADPARRAEVLKQAVAALEKNDPNRLTWRNRSFEEGRASYFADDRDMIGLLILVCGLLLFVTALGIVGLTSFWVGQRTRQIGVRRALGATRGQILGYFQTENFLIASVGIALGMILAFGLNQLLMAHYELPRLPVIYLPAGAVVLWLLGQLAVLGPARRAASVPPAIATRSA
ncbi:MAG TPA: FtsX-like permease family protein [Chiayiivirga sp.]|nr:FtsX-like permease family protein [Chiayiivirga sp.]